MEIEKGSQSRNEQKEHGNSKFAKLKVAFNPAGLVVAKLDCNVDHTRPIYNFHRSEASTVLYHYHAGCFIEHMLTAVQYMHRYW